MNEQDENANAQVVDTVKDLCAELGFVWIFYSRTRPTADAHQKRKIRNHLSRAKELGYQSIADRYDNDEAFRTNMAKINCDRDQMIQWDVIAAEPVKIQGRTWEQRMCAERWIEWQMHEDQPSSSSTSQQPEQQHHGRTMRSIQWTPAAWQSWWSSAGTGAWWASQSRGAQGVSTDVVPFEPAAMQHNTYWMILQTIVLILLTTIVVWWLMKRKTKTTEIAMQTDTCDHCMTCRSVAVQVQSHSGLVVVYVSPHGERFHRQPNCPGLRSARSFSRRTPCAFCDDLGV